MTPWVGDAGSSSAILHVPARSGPDELDVDWRDTKLPADDVPDASASLRQFLDSARRLPAAAAARAREGATVLGVPMATAGLVRR